jgi:hypothetical protein
LPLGFTAAKACFGPDSIEAIISLYLTGKCDGPRVINIQDGMMIRAGRSLLVEWNCDDNRNK